MMDICQLKNPLTHAQPICPSALQCISQNGKRHQHLLYTVVGCFKNLHVMTDLNLPLLVVMYREGGFGKNSFFI